MATQRMTVLKDMRYGTRMLSAGDLVDMKGPDVRFYTAVGAVGPLARGGTVTAPKPVVGERPGESLVTAERAAATKAASRKRTAKRRATAKK